MDHLQLTGQNLGQVFNFRSGHWHAVTFLVLSVKLPNLQLKTQTKQLLGSLPLVTAFPSLFNAMSMIPSPLPWYGKSEMKKNK
jgi:hypothetical protein